MNRREKNKKMGENMRNWRLKHGGKIDPVEVFASWTSQGLTREEYLNMVPEEYPYEKWKKLVNFLMDWLEYQKKNSVHYTSRRMTYVLYNVFYGEYDDDKIMRNIGHYTIDGKSWKDFI